MVTKREGKMNGYEDTHSRSVLKALSWRIVASTTTFSLVFIFTGQLALSAGVSAVEVVTKLILYYLHERLWCAVPLLRKRKCRHEKPLKIGSSKQALASHL